MKQQSTLIRLSVQLYLVMLFVVMGSSTVIAGYKDCNDPKWSNHPICTDAEPDPDPVDLCLTEEFSPDFAFYRDTRSGKARTFTFFVADATTGCERAVLDFTRDYGLIYALSFSATYENEGVYLGRIVWRTMKVPDEVVWGYDFAVDEPNVVPVDGPYRVLDNEGDSSKNISNIMDLSPDRSTLAYYFWNSDYDGSIRIMNVDDCAYLGCDFDTSLSLALAEKSGADQESLGTPAWGPLSTRVYYKRSSKVEPAFSNLQYVDMPVGWTGSVSDLGTFEPEEKTLVSSLDQPDLPTISQISSGVINGSEALAVVIPTDSGCGYVSLIDVQTCNGSCLPEPMFFGVRPSITMEGALIHNYYREKANVCSKWGGTVGLYDGLNVSSVLKGFMPDAASGIR